jgi:myo-inositol 2-dehydrogenase/D-chiro-inositol 1-dehydrogenase
MHISSRDPEPPPIEYVKVSGGIFLDMTIHDFDMARFVTGSEVVEVFATGSVMVDQGIGNVGDFDTATVLLTHENGAVTTIDNCRQSAFGYDQRVEAFGSKGMVTSENHTATSMVRRTAEGSAGDVVPHFFLERYIPSYLRQWEQFIAAVQSGSPTPVTGADGRAPLVIGLAAKESAATNHPIRI